MENMRSLSNGSDNDIDGIFSEIKMHAFSL